MSLKDDGSKVLVRYARFTEVGLKKLLNHVSDLDKRISRLEKLVVVAIVSNLPQLVQIFLNL